MSSYNGRLLKVISVNKSWLALENNSSKWDFLMPIQHHLRSFGFYRLFATGLTVFFRIRSTRKKNLCKRDWRVPALRQPGFWTPPRALATGSVGSRAPHTNVQFVLLSLGASRTLNEIRLERKVSWALWSRDVFTREGSISTPAVSRVGVSAGGSRSWRK